MPASDNVFLGPPAPPHPQVSPAMSPGMVSAPMITIVPNTLTPAASGARELSMAHYVMAGSGGGWVAAPNTFCVLFFFISQLFGMIGPFLCLLKKFAGNLDKASAKICCFFTESALLSAVPHDAQCAGANQACA